MNDYLQRRNQKFYRGSTTVIHPLYEIELTNALTNLTSYLDKSILAKAKLLREKSLTSIALEKCWKNNNYAFSEAQQCTDLIFKHDSVLGNIKNYGKEIETNILAEYQNTINPQNVNIYKKNTRYGVGEPSQLLNEKELEVAHRKFLVNVHLFQRFYYYYFAKYLFIDSLKNVE